MVTSAARPSHIWSICPKTAYITGRPAILPDCWRLFIDLRDMIAHRSIESDGLSCWSALKLG
jgi:hypothetical protein